MTMGNRLKPLGILLKDAGLSCPAEFTRIPISSVTSDSREVIPGCLFVALAGASHDGHAFIQQAVEKGCSAVLVEKEISFDIPRIMTADTRAVLGYLAASFYDFPSREITLIGVTGTNGKTTSAWLIESLLKKAGFKTGVLGTVNIRFPGEEIHSSLTTPEPLELQKILRKMVDQKVSHVVMEVSSHALKQGRVNGLDFDVASFTNLSRDHLDYHLDMNDYFSVKKKLFSKYLKAGGKAVINLTTSSVIEENNKRANQVPSCHWGEELVGFLKEKNNYQVITCGLEKGDVHTESHEYSLKGIKAKIVLPGGEFKLESSLVGEFNLINLIGAVGCGLALDLSPESIRAGLEGLKAVPGRLERVCLPLEAEKPAKIKALSDRDSIAEPIVFIDYAHTPDALENVLSTLKPLVKKRLIAVFGCGGDRDKGKRSLMGEVAGRLADIVILTSDNPRSESPEEIINDIEQGLAGKVKVGIEEIGGKEFAYSILHDRRQAINETIAVSRPGDVIVICGKGHENYQIGKFGSIRFDDRLEAIEALNQKGNLHQNRLRANHSC